MSLPLDLGRLDFDGIRKRRRRRLLLWSLPVCACALLAAMGLGALYLSQVAGANAYANKKYQQAADTFVRFEAINFIDTYKMKYNQGTALVAARQYEKSQAALERALELGAPADFECQIRVNLVHAINGRTEQLVAEKKYDEAILLYDTAKAVIDARDCGMKSTTSKSPSDDARKADKKLQTLRTEITKKQNIAKQKRNGDDPDKKNSEPSQEEAGNADNASTPSDDQLQRLQDQQSKNATKTRDSRTRERAYQGDSSYSGRDYNKKNW